MIRFGWRGGFSCLVVGLLVGDAVAQNPTFSLIPTAFATRKCTGGPENGLACNIAADCERDAQGVVRPECQRVCQAGENDGEPCATRFDCTDGSCLQKCFCNYWVSASPNDFVLTKIWGSNWSPNGEFLHAWQAAIDLSPVCSAVRPFGWDKPCDGATAIECFDDQDCLDDDPQYPICDLGFNDCRGPRHAPESVSFICAPPGQPCRDSDYVFFTLDELKAVDYSTVDFRYGSTLLFPQGPLYTSPKYFATLTLQIQPVPFGCGTVTVGLNLGDSFMLDRNGQDITPLEAEGLTIVLPPCVPQGILSSAPSNCIIDARQNFEPDGTSPGNRTSIVLKLLDGQPLPTTITTSDFRMREIPDVGAFNADSFSLDDPAVGFATVTFPPATAGAWTCIRYKNFFDSEVCFGSQPGDADGNLISEAVDLTHITDCITGAATCEPRECDMDRSGTCSGPDLLRAVDLLRGAESYFPGWLGSSLSACPTGP